MSDFEFFNKIRIEAKQTGVSLTQMYANIRKKAYDKKFQKSCPNIWKELLSKRYLLPNYRQKDYVSQEAYNYFLVDFLVTYSMEEFQKGNEILNTEYVSLMRRLECGCPTYFLERELGEALYRARLPDDYDVSDIKWKFPSIRVYLPKGLLNIKREGTNYLVFLDIVKIEKEQLYDLPWKIKEELLLKLGVLPPYGAKNQYTGMGVSGPLDLDEEFGGVMYAGSTGLENTKIKKVFDTYSVNPLKSESKMDSTDQKLVDAMLMLGFNILLFLSSYPLEIDSGPSQTPKDEIIRPIRQDGDGFIPGLFKAKFIGQSQLRWKDKQHQSNVYPTTLGRPLQPHWRAGHWKRIPYGPGQSLRRLGFIETYHVGTPPNV